MIFSGTMKVYKHTFRIGNSILENVTDCIYLGIALSK